MDASNPIPDSSPSFRIDITNKMFIVDPLSVIIKLAILGYKKIGTKICINNNVVGIQEPGMFQSIIRFIFNNNKQDLHYLYNPIEFACKSFLTENNKNIKPGIIKLFEGALYGLTKLKETYNNSPISILALDYYYVLITNYLYKPYNNKLFKPNDMTSCYTEEFIDVVNKIWTDVKLQAVTDLNGYLLSKDNSPNNSNCLEIFMRDVDVQMYKTIEDYILPKMYKNFTEEINNSIRIYADTNNNDTGAKNIQPFTPLRDENAKSSSLSTLITAHEVGVLNVQRCNESESLVEFPRAITESPFGENGTVPVVAPSKDYKNRQKK